MPERELHLGWFDWLTRQRPKLYGILAVLYLLAFNGFWRVGVDSALYRGLARSLAYGHGYVFAGEHHRHAYPGLPWMLAIFERLFGDSPIPGLLLMTAMAFATLFLIDRLIALRYPLWVATVVTIGMALNVRFIRQSQQLMTDVPFTLGVIGSLYALERLRLLVDAKWPTIVKWAAMMVAGLALAATMRPTFGVLAGAIVIGSAFRLFITRGSRRYLHGGILLASILVMLGLFLVDPRTRGFSPMQGVYEQELVDRVQELPDTMLGQLQALLGRDLNDAFFSQRLAPVNYLASAAVLFASALVLRRNIVWGLMIFGLVAITLPLSTVPRYFLMVMPFLWLGWVLLCCAITLRIPDHLKGPVLGLALGFPMMVNGGRSVGFVLEQRAPDVAWLLHHEDRAHAFYSAYRDGEVPKQIAMAKLIAEHSTPEQKIVGPYAHVLAYYADRRVIGERTLFIDREVALSKLPALLAKANPDLALLPLMLYGDNDSLMREMLRFRILTSKGLVAENEQGMQLVAAAVRVPPVGTNWRTRPPTELSTTRRASTTQRGDLAKRREKIAQRELKEQRAQKAQKAAKLEKRAKLERQQKLDRAEKRKRLEKRDRQKRHDAVTPATTPAS